jgi:hypothetical protein
MVCSTVGATTESAEGKELKMGTFQVRLFPNGGDYQKVEAKTAKEAAEKLYDRELSEVGSQHQLRVLVHRMKWPRDPSPTLFYDRS